MSFPKESGTVIFSGLFGVAGKELCDEKLVEGVLTIGIGLGL